MLHIVVIVDTPWLDLKQITVHLLALGEMIHQLVNVSFGVMFLFIIHFL